MNITAVRCIPHLIRPLSRKLLMQTCSSVTSVPDVTCILASAAAVLAADVTTQLRVRYLLIRVHVVYMHTAIASMSVASTVAFCIVWRDLAFRRDLCRLVGTHLAAFHAAVHSARRMSSSQLFAWFNQTADALFCDVYASGLV